MAYVDSDLNKINQAIATGAKRVKFQGHETEFRDLDEMLRVRDLIKSELSANTSAGVSFAEYSDGK